MRFSSSLKLIPYNEKLTESNSYNLNKKQEILKKWAKLKNCQWLTNVRLNSSVLAYTHNVNKLRTPLSIRDFAVQSSGINELKELINLIDTSSEDTIKSYIKEFEHLSSDKLAFLLFPFVLENIELDEIETRFNTIINHSISGTSQFSSVLRSFRFSDKVDIISYAGMKKFIRISHPSYHQAIESLLVENRNQDQTISYLFNNVLRSLLNLHTRKERLAEIIETYFDICCRGIQEWLFRQADGYSLHLEIIKVAHKRNNFRANSDMKDLLGLEAYIILLSVLCQDELIIEEAKNENVDWKKVLNYMLILGKLDLSFYDRFIGFYNVPLPNKTKVKRFKRKLFSLFVESKLKRKIRSIRMNLEQIEEMIQSEEFLNQFSTNDYTVMHKDIVLSVIKKLERQNYISLSLYRTPGYYFAKPKLIKEVPNTNIQLYYDKVFDILSNFFVNYKCGDNTKGTANEIASKIRPYMQGRIPNSIAAGILNYMKKRGHIKCTVNYISRKCSVNPATTNKIYLEISNLIETNPGG
jgi:hypothetical protein